MIPYCREEGEGEVVLFLHGLGGDARAWDPQISHFSRTYRTAAWDMPGYGKSDLDAPMTFALLSDSLLALLDDRRWEKIHLVGHSLGGMVAQTFAVDHQDRLRSLCLFATSSAFGRSDGEFQRAFVAERLGPLDAGLSMNDVAEEMVQSLLPASAEGRELAHSCMAGVPKATYRAAVACIATFDGRDNLPRIEVPTLVLSAEADRNAPAPMMQRMADRISGSRYTCLAGLGHLANLENPSAFNRALETFLETVSSNGSA